jgi:hypothetical protein
VPAPSDFVRLAPEPLGEKEVLIVDFTFSQSHWLRASKVRGGFFRLPARRAVGRAPQSGAELGHVTR